METDSPHSSQGPLPWTCLVGIGPASHGFLRRIRRVARTGLIGELFEEVALVGGKGFLAAPDLSGVVVFPFGRESL